MKEEDPFDMDNLRINAKALCAEPDVRAKRRKHAEPFVQVPLSLMERLSGRRGAVYAVAIYLHQNWKNPGELITLSNVTLEAWGVSREEKRKALPELEALGLISVERRGNRAPRVKLL